MLIYKINLQVKSALMTISKHLKISGFSNNKTPCWAKSHKIKSIPFISLLEIKFKEKC